MTKMVYLFNLLGENQASRKSMMIITVQTLISYRYMNNTYMVSDV